MKHYTKRNIRIRIIALSIAFSAWGFETMLLWNSTSRFPIYLVFIILVGSSISDYIGWKKYKSTL
jgi:hypothetical protein